MGHVEEQRDIITPQQRIIEIFIYNDHTLICILPARVDDIDGAVRRGMPQAWLKYMEKAFGQCKVGWDSCMHTWVQLEHRAGEVYTHQCAYIDAIKPIDVSFSVGKGE